MKTCIFPLFSAILLAGVLCLSGCTPAGGGDAPATTYTVTFSANAGTDTVTSMPDALSGIQSGAKITSPAKKPERSGYVFAGWYKENTTVTEWNFSSDTITSSLTLYALWRGEDKSCIITFDTGASGWKCDPIAVEKNSSFENLENKLYISMLSYLSTDPDYYPSGVYSDSGYVKSEAGSATFAESTTLYIKMIRQYAVTIYPNGGVFADGSAAVKTVKIKEQDTVSSIYDTVKKPTKDGYVFSRWTSDEAGTTEVAESAKVTGPLTLYAQWTKLDTDVNGWWRYTNTQNTASFIKLDTQSGSGFMYDVSVSNGLKVLSLSDTKITVGSAAYPYTYAADTHTLTFNGISCVRPSETKTPGGSDSGVYYASGMLMSLNADNTCTLTSTNNTTVSLSGKWCRDGSSLYLLDDDSQLVMSVQGTKLDYDTFGGHYYNYTGTASSGSKDAYSLYLDKDGTYQLYIAGHEAQGMWYAEESGSSLWLKLSGGYGNCFTNAISCDGSTFTAGSGTERITLVQSAAKGTVYEFAEDPKLTGTWAMNQQGINEEFTFTSDGTEQIYMKMGEITQTVSYYYLIADNTIYSIPVTQPNVLLGLSSSSTPTFGYSVNDDGTVASFTGNGQTIPLTKK